MADGAEDDLREKCVICNEFLRVGDPTPRFQVPSASSAAARQEKSADTSPVESPVTSNARQQSGAPNTPISNDAPQSQSTNQVEPVKAPTADNQVPLAGPITAPTSALIAATTSTLIAVPSPTLITASTSTLIAAPTPTLVATPVSIPNAPQPTPNAALPSRSRKRKRSPSPDPEQIAVIQPCKHILHASCLKKWYQRENSCPICRTKFNVVSIVDFIGGPVVRTTHVRDARQRPDLDDFSRPELPEPQNVPRIRRSLHQRLEERERERINSTPRRGIPPPSRPTESNRRNPLNSRSTAAAAARNAQIQAEGRRMEQLTARSRREFEQTRQRQRIEEIRQRARPQEAQEADIFAAFDRARAGLPGAEARPQSERPLKRHRRASGE